MWSSIPHMDDLITIKTNYQPTLKSNADITYPRDQDRYKFTQIQRKCASKAVVPSNLADFEVKVGCSKGSFFRSELILLVFSFRNNCFQGNAKEKHNTFA
jgi:hypothetical protein